MPGQPVRGGIETGADVTQPGMGSIWHEQALGADLSLCDVPTRRLLGIVSNLRAKVYLQSVRVDAPDGRHRSRGDEIAHSEHCR